MKGQIPSLAQVQQYRVNRVGEFEGVRQSLYDFQAYPVLGQTQLSFYQVPIGQNNKTVADTNMTNAGVLPTPKSFLIETIEVFFFPGVLPGTMLTTVAATNFANDMYTIAKSGSLNLFIGSKSYLIEAPIGRFPTKTRLDVDPAHAINELQAAAANSELQVSSDYAAFAGRPYYITPEILLQPNQNFSVTLDWPAAVTLPSGTIGRIGIVMDGILYRESQ